MKKLLFTTFALAAITTAKAQQVKLNVILKQVQTLTVNDQQKTVDLVYNTAKDYEDGVSKTNNNHLTIYSTGGFQVKVKSNQANISVGNKTMEINTLKLTSSAGSQALSNATYKQDLQLSTTDAVLVSSPNGAVNKSVDVLYKGAGANAYIDNYVAGQNPTTYSYDLVYSIVSA